VPYVLHDETVDRTTGATGAIAELDSSHLDALPLPRLEAVPELGVPLLVEIKAGPVEAIYPLLRGEWFVQSFVEEIARGHGLLRGALDPDPVSTARRLDLAAYNPHWSLVTPSLVRDLHAAGVAVLAWTADEPAAWSALCAAGVDGIITNRPGELRTWLA
jgi:glycerophosphoryl diester phosphodiesterase